MKVKQGSYIVTLKFQGGFVGNCGKENYCFKQKCDDEYMAPVLDLQGNTRNSHSILSFDCKGWLLEWRYATGEEAAEYDRLGKPYDVTTLKPNFGYYVSLKTEAIYITGFNIGCIAECLDNFDKVKFNNLNNYSIPRNHPSVKWFATLKEAEEFSNQLLKKESEPPLEQFYIKYDKSITAEKFAQLCNILNERIGPFVEHCDIGLSYNNFVSPFLSGDDIGYIRTEFDRGKPGWCLDNNKQGIKKEKFIEDFISSTKYDPYTFEPQYNVGDYIITDGYSETYDGRILRITEITTYGSSGYAYFEVIDGGEWSKSHNFGSHQIKRKATQQEIDVYLKKPNPIYPKDYEAWLEYIKHKTFSNLEELETIIDRSSTCDFAGVYEKIPGFKTSEKAKWVWENILYPVDIIPFFSDQTIALTKIDGKYYIDTDHIIHYDVGDFGLDTCNYDSITTKDTKKTLPHQKPYIVKSPKKINKFVRITK